MSRPVPARANVTFDDLLLDDAHVDPDGLTLLAAYRDAAEVARQATKSAAGAAEPTAAADESPDESRRGLPSVLRLRTVSGLAPELLGSLHGRLIAAGYLSAEIVGRADGLAYRVTRDGIRRLTGETAEPEAA